MKLASVKDQITRLRKKPEPESTTAASPQEQELRAALDKYQAYAEVLKKQNAELSQENVRVGEFIRAISPFLLRLSILDLDSLETADDLVPFKFQKEELKMVLRRWKESKNGKSMPPLGVYGATTAQVSYSYSPSPSSYPTFWTTTSTSNRTCTSAYMDVTQGGAV